MVRSLPVVFSSIFQDVSFRDLFICLSFMCVVYIDCVCVCVCVCVENAGERESSEILVLEKGKDTGRSLQCSVNLHEVKGHSLERSHGGLSEVG